MTASDSIGGKAAAGAHRDHALSLLLDAVIDYAIYMLDPEGRVVSWNAGAERLKGYTAAEVEGRSFAEFFTPDDRENRVPEHLLETAAREGRVESEGWRLRKDGTLFWALATLHAIRGGDGQLLGYTKITRDMTAQRMTQQAMLESERRFRLLVEGVTDYAIYMLDPAGIVTNWNRGAERIKGYAADEIVGQHFSRFYTDGDRESGLPQRALDTAREAGRYEAEGWRVRKDGTIFWASVVIDAIRDDAGNPIGFAKITRDITDKRNAELDLRRAHEQLAQSQKMEAIGQLTGGVAHDFNNLLMVVSGQAQLLKKRFADDPRAQRSIEAIEISARRGQDLTRHLLSFARRQRLQSVTLSLRDRLEGTRSILATSLPPSISLAISLPDELWPVDVDPNELDLAVLNLAVNARDAMPDGGRLTVSAKNVVDPTLELIGDFVALSVADTGVGIPSDILPKIFDPFFTTKDVDKGTGLGLSQVFGFARQCGGEVLATSILGKGTAFTLYFPRSGGAPVAAALYEAAPQARSAHILLVEDNPEVSEVATGLLEQIGHRVSTANNVATALKVMADTGPPDLVFSDVVMAGTMDGVDFARQLRRDHPGLPVLLATGYSQTVERLGDEFPILRKPYEVSELALAINSLLASRESALA